MRSSSNKILFLILGRHVGGMEKRFANLYKYMSQDSSVTEPAIFLVSKSLVRKLDAFSASSNDAIKLVTYGVSYSAPNKSSYIEKMIRYLEYILLGMKLLYWMPVLKFKAVHFISPASLNFKKLVRTKRKIYSFVNSGKFEKDVYTKRFTNMLKGGFVVDCLSEDLKKIIQSLNIAENNNLKVTPCSFIDYELASVSAKRYKICFVSRFETNKGIEMLLPALDEVFERWYPKLEFHFMGYGSLQEEIESFLKGKTYMDRMNIYYCGEPMKELSDSLIFLSLQERENYPSQSLIEAMACGNAIVATDVGLTRQLVKEEFGILVHDKQSLVEAIDNLLLDYDATILRGERARDFVMTEHTVEKYYNYLLAECYS